MTTAKLELLAFQRAIVDWASPAAQSLARLAGDHLRAGRRGVAEVTLEHARDAEREWNARYA